MYEHDTVRAAGPLPLRSPRSTVREVLRWIDGVEQFLTGLRWRSTPGRVQCVCLSSFIRALLLMESIFKPTCTYCFTSLLRFELGVSKGGQAFAGEQVECTIDEEAGRANEVGEEKRRAEDRARAETARTSIEPDGTPDEKVP